MDSSVAPRISDDELPRLLALIGGSDSVELKLTVPEAYGRSAVKALGVDPLEAQLRQVFFFDTPELALDAAGVVVRARRVQGGKDDSVVKLRPVDPSDLPENVRSAKGFKVEVDAMPGGFVCSGSFKRRTDPGAVKRAIDGEAPIRGLFSKAQRAFFAAHAPTGIELDDLTLLGPVMVLKLKHTPDGSDRPLTVELWTYPDGARILELSTKSAPNEAFQVAAEGRALLTQRGISLDGEQATKTRTALEFFSRELAAG